MENDPNRAFGISIEQRTYFYAILDISLWVTFGQVF